MRCISLTAVFVVDEAGIVLEHITPVKFAYFQSIVFMADKEVGIINGFVADVALLSEVITLVCRLNMRLKFVAFTKISDEIKCFQTISCSNTSL